MGWLIGVLIFIGCLLAALCKSSGQADDYAYYLYLNNHKGDDDGNNQNLQ